MMKLLFKVIVLVQIGIAVLSLFPIAMSPMMFDAPGSTKDPALLLFFGLIATFPIVIGISVCSASLQKELKLAFRWLAVPLIPVVVALVLVAFKTM